MRILAEQEMLNLNDRLRSQLLEIESALGRIESGAFGFCEETDEPIEDVQNQDIQEENENNDDSSEEKEEQQPKK